MCKIDNIEKHPNADKLDICTVKGWNCITGLNQYKIGDKVVFVPPDSIIPDNLIEKYNLTYLKNGGRVGTTKLRGYISQGLILNVPEGNYKVGQDVAKELGITKWQPPECSYNPNSNGKPTKKKQNPLFDKYTDIENIKNYNNIFTPEDKVVITEKIHGSNWRASNLPIYLGHQNIIKRIFNKIKSLFTDKYEFVYGSHNVQLTYTNRRNCYYGEDVYGKVAEKYNMKNIIPKDYIVYGEVYGNKIQDLTYGLSDIDLVIFDVKYKGKYLPFEAFMDFCEKRNLPVAPVLYVGEWKPELISKFTDGKSALCPKQIKEGIVVKDYYEGNHPRVGRKILKSVSVDYLTRKNATEFK